MTKTDQDKKLDEEWHQVWARSVADDRALGLIVKRLPKEKAA